MGTKKELSDQANEILDTDLDFSGMKKDELELFVELLDEGSLIEPQGKHVVKKHGKNKLEDQVDEWHPGKLISSIL